jgi:putative peptide zinc metalloprotease protein
LWYRIASIKPRLRSHVSIHRHNYRNQLWFVLYDQLTGKNHRFTPIANHLISKMDGNNTVQSIWQDAVIHFGDEAPTQDEVIQLLGQLHGNNVLATDISPDSLEIFERYTKHKKQNLKQKLMSPMALRFPLLDPERFLNRFKFLFIPLFGWFGAVLWIAVVGTGIFMGAMYWPELTENVEDRALTPQNFVLLWFVFPIVKALHELGHGFAVKVWGGEVHEIGIMLLVFIPVPYVDASASSAFV